MDILSRDKNLPYCRVTNHKGPDMARISRIARHLFLPSALVAVWACGGGDLTLPGKAGPPADLLLVSGDSQSAQPSTELPVPLVVRLVDDQGNAVPAGTISWVVGAGGGSASPASVATDTLGLASTRLTLGPAPGLNTVNAVVSGVDVVTFTASAAGGGGGGGGGGDEDSSPDHLVFQVQPSDANKGERITPAVAVAVVDRQGDLVTNFKFKIELVLASGSGKLEGKREQDTKDGIATFEDLKVDEPGEGNVLRALAPEDAFLGIVESQPFDIHED